MRTLVLLAGIFQIVVAVGSLTLPRLLGWREETARLRPLTRQVFWTYAGYIWATNVSFGLLSLGGTAWLLDGSPLARAVAGYIALYWGARLVIQFAYFDRSSAPPGAFFKLAEVGLVGLFIFFTATYGALAWS